jgi:hypothetical protein
LVPQALPESYTTKPQFRTAVNGPSLRLLQQILQEQHILFAVMITSVELWRLGSLFA